MSGSALERRICFVEGTLEFNGDAAAATTEDYGTMWPGRSAGWSDGFMRGPPTALQMLPAWVSLGDYDNILYARHLMQIGDRPPDDWKLTEHLDLIWPSFETPRRQAVLSQANTRVLLYSAGMAHVYSLNCAQSSKHARAALLCQYGALLLKLCSAKQTRAYCSTLQVWRMTPLPTTVTRMSSTLRRLRSMVEAATTLCRCTARERVVTTCQAPTT